MSVNVYLLISLSMYSQTALHVAFSATSLMFGYSFK